MRSSRIQWPHDRIRPGTGLAVRALPCDVEPAAETRRKPGGLCVDATHLHEHHPAAPGRGAVPAQPHSRAGILVHPRFRSVAGLLLRHARPGLLPRRPGAGLPRRSWHRPHAGPRSGRRAAGRARGAARRGRHWPSRRRHLRRFLVGPLSTDPRQTDGAAARRRRSLRHTHRADHHLLHARGQAWGGARPALPLHVPADDRERHWTCAVHSA